MPQDTIGLRITDSQPNRCEKEYITFFSFHHHHQENISNIATYTSPPKCMLTNLLHTQMLMLCLHYCFNFWMAASCCISGKKKQFSLLQEPSGTANIAGWLLGVLIANGSMDRVQMFYGQCFRGWMCGSGSAGNRSRRNLWIISKLVKVITAAGVVRNRFVAHPR